MRFLADENISIPLIAALRNAGHDVASIREQRPGIGDKEVLGIAVSERRVLLTSDKKFVARLALAQEPLPPGIILLRFRGVRRNLAAELIAGAINAREDWQGHYSVLKPNHVRRRAL